LYAITITHRFCIMASSAPLSYRDHVHSLPTVLQEKVFLFVGPAQGMPTSEEISAAVTARQERIDYTDIPDLLEPMTFADVQSALSVAIDAGLTVDDLMQDPDFADAVQRMDGLTSDNMIYISQILAWGNDGINLEEIFAAEEDPSLIGEINWDVIDDVIA
jgi:hypothetical protein